jgi:XTP/dITP diphosphohydrolase
MELKLKELMIASKNKNKISEIKSIISADVKLKSFMDYENIPDIVEDAQSIEGNSIKKAVEIAKFTGNYSIADDTGIFVEYLGGEPGVLSARWAGPGCSYEDNNKKLLGKLKGVKWENRKAVFKCAITIASPDGRYHSRVGELNGYIGTEIKGNNGFGYDPLFFVPDFSMTLAEMNAELKNKISHRAIALKLIKPVIDRLLNYGIF